MRIEEDGATTRARVYKTTKFPIRIGITKYLAVQQEGILYENRTRRLKKIHAKKRRCTKMHIRRRKACFALVKEVFQ